MRSAHQRRIALASVVLMLGSVACGLKTEAKDRLEQSLANGGGGNLLNGNGGGDLGTGGGDLGTGGGDLGTGGSGTGGSGTGSGLTGGGTGGTGTGGTGTGGTGTGGTGTGGTGTGGTGTGGSGTGTGGGGGGTVTPTGGTTTGISATEIHIGIHAPLSGASPVPQASFEKGAKNFWLDKKVFGRKVVVEILDDTYKPSGAVRVCEEMARRDFIVIGGAGTDQIQACGRDRQLQRTNTPYLSAGVTTNGLTGLRTYFAFSMTYQAQGALLVKAAREQGYLTKGKWAVVRSDTPNFADASEGIRTALGGAGVQYEEILVPKSGSDSDAVSLSNKLRGGRYPVVYFLGQPTFFLKVVGQTQNAAYKPVWTGVGISMGLNTVCEIACGATGSQYDGRFLSPYPGLDRAPAAFKAADNGRKKDDIELTLWGLSELLYQALLKTNGVLTRENFIAKLETATLPGGTYPSVRFSPQNHFGGTAAYLLKSDCGKREYVTQGGQRS